jgi:hypothetical protein
MAQQRPVYNIVFLLFDFVWKPGHYINFGKSFLKVETINNLFSQKNRCLQRFEKTKIPLF